MFCLRRSEGLGTASFVTVTNLVPDCFSCTKSLLGKFFLPNAGFDAMVCKQRSEKNLVSLDIGQHPEVNIMHWRFRIKGILF